MSGITGTSSLVLALRADGERTQFETAQRALEMQNRTDDSAARTQAAAAEVIGSLTKRNAELEAQLLSKDQAHSIIITGIVTGHAAEKAAFEAQVISLKEAVSMRDSIIASLQALIENVKAGIRYLYEMKELSPWIRRVNQQSTRWLIIEYLTQIFEGKIPVLLADPAHHKGIPLNSRLGISSRFGGTDMDSPWS